MRASLILFVVLWLSTSLYAQEDTARVEAIRFENTVFLELGGQGIFYTVNYDRLISQKFSLRAGYGFFDLLGLNRHCALLMINGLFGPALATGRFEIGAGPMITAGYKDTGYNQIYAPGEPGFSNANRFEYYRNLGFTLTIAYRYQPIDSHLSFRIGAAQLWDADLVVLPAISIGYAF